MTIKISGSQILLAITDLSKHFFKNLIMICPMFWIRIQWNPDPANTFRIRSPWIRRGSGFAETGSGSRGPLNPVPDPKHWFWQTVRIRIQIYGCIRIRIKHKRSRNAGCFLFVSHHYWRVSMDPDPHWSPMRNLVSNFNYANLNYRFFLNII